MLNESFNLEWQKSDKKSTRDGYGDALLELGKINPNVVVVTADLAESTRTEKFGKSYSDRFFDVGVAEQNLMSVGGGLAATGLIPFISSYAMFSPGRNWEQLRNTVCYGNLNVKIASSHAGLSVGPDGATHQALEDIALTRVLPNLTVISPCDYHQARLATFGVANLRGPVYLRLSRLSTHQITTSRTLLEVGKAQTLCFGDAVTLVSTGVMVAECLQAAAEIDAEVVNIHTIKPIDIETIIQSVKKTKRLIVVEEHQQAGGLGSAVLEALAEKSYYPPVKLMGVADQFGQSGTAEELLEAYGLTWHHIIKTYKSFI
jgi:transketolase